MSRPKLLQRALEVSNPLCRSTQVLLQLVNDSKRLSSSFQLAFFKRILLSGGNRTERFAFKFQLRRCTSQVFQFYQGQDKWQLPDVVKNTLFLHSICCKLPCLHCLT